MKRALLCYKIGIMVIILVAIYFVCDQGQEGNWSNLASHLAAWDGADYLQLSEAGYTAGAISCAFYPLWPGLIHVVTKLTMWNPVLISFLLSNAMSFLSLCIFFEMVKDRFGDKTAKDSLILLLASPGALFLSIPYTESLFLLLVMVFFWGIRHERYTLVGFSCLLLPMSKAIGIFILLPLASHVFENKRSWKKRLLLVVPIVGYACYFGIMWAYTNNCFEGFVAQASYPNSPSIKNMFDIVGISNAFLDIHSLDGMMDGILDRVLFMVFLFLVPMVYWLDKGWFFYTLSAGMVPALTNWFLSYRRFFIVLFPLFVVIARIAAKTNNPLIFWYLVGSLIALQCWALIQFATFGWAG